MPEDRVYNLPSVRSIRHCPKTDKPITPTNNSINNAGKDNFFIESLGLFLFNHNTCGVGAWRRVLAALTYRCLGCGISETEVVSDDCADAAAG